MSFQEKLDLLEALWDELKVTPDNIPTPGWHRELLSERARRLEAGDEEVLDWDEVKAQLRERLR